jgi:hypothetical protein
MPVFAITPAALLFFSRLYIYQSKPCLAQNLLDVFSSANVLDILGDISFSFLIAARRAPLRCSFVLGNSQRFHACRLLTYNRFCFTNGLFNKD